MEAHERASTGRLWRAAHVRLAAARWSLAGPAGCARRGAQHPTAARRADRTHERTARPAATRPARTLRRRGPHAE
eukprot:7114475-Prymnesium_polylepis.1